MEYPLSTASIHVLDNGLHLILDPDDSAPVISAQAWVETGSIHEDKFSGAGISHLLEHMVFKGTRSWDSEQLSLSVQGAGGQWNAYTSFDRTVYYIDGPSDSTDLFLKVLGEMVFFPSFPQEEFEKEKDVIRREIDMGKDDPGSVANQLLFSTVFSQDNRKHPVIGHLELFNQISHQDMLDYHRDRYHTGNVFFCLSGDFDPQHVLEALQAQLGELPRQFDRLPLIEQQPPALGKKTRSQSYNIPTTKLALNWTTPGLHHPDSPALDLLSTILGGGRSSWLYQTLREQQQLCHHILAWAWSTPQPTGMFSVQADVEYEKKDQLIESVLKEIRNLVGAPLLQELNKAKRMCLSTQFNILTSASGRASDLASNWNSARSLNFTRDYLNQIQAVTEQDIQRVLQEYLLRENNFSVISLDPEDKKTTNQSSTGSKKTRSFHRHTLSNGLELVLCPHHKTPLTNIQMVSKAGLLNETADNSGISHLMGNLLTKGTTQRTGKEFAEQIESMGASLSAASGNNTALISASALSDDLETITNLLSECVEQPLFDPSQLQQEVLTLRKQIQEESQDPVSLAFRQLKASLFDGHGYGLSTLGSLESIDTISRDQLVAHHQNIYTAANSVTAFFGDIDVDKTIEIAEQTLGKLATASPLQLPTQRVTPGKEIHLQLDKQQAVLSLGYPGAHLDHPQIHALNLLNNWFSDMAGPLFSHIREELGLAYFVSSTQFIGEQTGFFGFYLGTSPESLEQAREELTKVISHTTQQGMDQQTLERVKSSWLAQQALANQSNHAMARMCAIDTLFGFGPEHHLQTSQQVQALTTQDIQSAAEVFFGNIQPTVVTVSPESP